MATTEIQPDKRPLMAEVTAFQRDALRAMDDIAPCAGADVKRWLSCAYGSEQNHGRLYPNLDKLEAHGLIECRVRGIDGSTNEYRLTDDGEAFLEALRDD